MMKFAIFAMLVAAAAAGIVAPIERCGGDGIPLQLRITNCEGAPPCTIIPETDYDIEEDFTAARSGPVNFRLTASTSLGELVVSDGPIGDVGAGISYTAAQTIRISNVLAGHHVTARIEVYQSRSNILEICVEAGMNITEPE